MTHPLAMTPPMGWNSWNTFGEKINEQVVLETADLFVKLGLKDAGYEYIVIDDCWSLRERDPKTNEIVPDPVKFRLFHGLRKFQRHFLMFVEGRSKTFSLKYS